MAQWQELLRLDWTLQSRVSQVYEGRFPREIRHCLSNWIESQNWDLVTDDETAGNCFRELLEHLDQQYIHSVQQNNILQGPDFCTIKIYLLNCFRENPLNLAMILSECLKEEKKILAEAEGYISPAVDKHEGELDNRVKDLRNQTWEVEREIKSLQDLNDKLDFIQENWESQVEQVGSLMQPQVVLEEECRKQASFITQTKQMVLQQIVDILNLAQQIVSALTAVELPEWKCRQQQACIGAPIDTCLNQLETWFTTVAEVLQQIRQQLKKLQEHNKKYDSNDASNLLSTMAEIENFTVSLFTKLLENALVVEKQPCMSSLSQRPLILKTHVQFIMKVRFLANLPEFKCLLQVKPEFDKDVEEVRTINGFRQFIFTKADQKVLDVGTPGGSLEAEFGHMSLKEHKGRTKGSNENRLGVTEELHVIKFVTTLQHAGLVCNIEASSLPVVVVSSSSQIPSAWASVIWWNIVSLSCTSNSMNLSLFVDPPAVTWQQLSEVLSWQFVSVSQRGLDENQLSMLRDRITGNSDGLDCLIDWKKFSKNESAWIWIDGILDLIKKYLVDLWQKGFIMGFVSRARAQLLLQERQSGTFLLRFSESIKDGAITFSWVEHSNGETYVHAVEPYTKKELLATSLVDIICDYSLKAEGNVTRNPLLYLYPDIPKDSVFGSHDSTEMSAPRKDRDGYVFRRNIPMSLNPTPPPSPPSLEMVMEPDINNMTVDNPEFDCEIFWNKEETPHSLDVSSSDSINPAQLCPSI
ncbi:hypothetical protein LDENG_00049430 [Lucifuga dentata]|nr:hypothetical protein LDENG_00049430 [Lucifuga dentata]